jgi:hypothetical protein
MSNFTNGVAPEDAARWLIGCGEKNHVIGVLRLLDHIFLTFAVNTKDKGVNGRTVVTGWPDLSR